MYRIVLVAAIVVGGSPAWSGAAPERFTVKVARDDTDQTLVLERHSLRSPGFAARIYGADGIYRPFVADPPRTYRGRIEGVPDSHVVAHLDERGLTARVLSANDPEGWRLAPDGTVTKGAGLTGDDFDCPIETLPAVPAPSARPPMMITGQHLTEIAFDVDFQYYQLKGSSVQASIDAVEAIMNEVDFFYARDLLVNYQITDVLVRTSQFYFPNGGGNLLDLFRLEWNANQTGIQRDIAHMMTNKSGIEFGGLAYVGATCDLSWAYGWSLDSTNIVGHELGHNWGSGHCHDLSPCNNMCGGCFYIAPNTKDIMTAYRDSVGCLDQAGPYPTPLPPYAHPDGLSLTRDELAVLGSTPFDVLGNDHDGNLDPLALDGFDVASQQGGGVTLSEGTGPDGRDELVYAPPGFVFPGEDRFDYTVGDGTGEQQVGNVAVGAPARRLVGYWRLDDGSGSLVTDSSNLGRDGTVEGSPSWIPGMDLGALRFDGVDDAAVLPPLYLRGDAVTLSAWVYRLGAQNDFSGLVFSRDENTIAGLSLTVANELRYHWNGDYWWWSPGLTVPDLQWVFVALVIEPDRATIYLHDGTLQSAVHVQPHGMEEFDGLLKLAHDTDSPSRHFRGALDDVRIYDHALTPADVLELAASGGKAVAPNPRDGGQRVPALAELGWIAGLSADSHDIYLGDDYVQVRDASTGSTQYRGNQTATTYAIDEPPISPTGVWAWRVDEHVGQDVIAGDVWLFSLARTAGHWPLDETAGPVAADVEQSNDGIYQGGIQLAQAGATAASGNSVRLDGADDFVQIPALGLNRVDVTITGWARRDGPQSDFAGIVFSRAGDTVAGISTRAGGELRYHWNDDQWSWSSGLTLPDGDWVFFALVVGPDLATIHLGQDGNLVSASNHALHGVEEFDGPLDLGRDGTVNRYFRGWLDDVRVYEAALTAADVAGLYQQALLPPGAGSLLRGELVVGKVPPGSIALDWSPSCLAGDDDYAVYEGAIGDFASHGPSVCTTAGATTADLSPRAGGRYYLVVPQRGAVEGDYGADSAGASRPAAVSPCLPQQVANCD